MPPPLLSFSLRGTLKTTPPTVKYIYKGILYIPFRCGSWYTLQQRCAAVGNANCSPDHKQEGGVYTREINAAAAFVISTLYLLYIILCARFILRALTNPQHQIVYAYASVLLWKGRNRAVDAAKNSYSSIYSCCFFVKSYKCIYSTAVPLYYNIKCT